MGEIWFRLIVFMINLTRSYGDFLLSMLQMQNWFFFIFYSVMLYENFRFTETLYHFMIEEGFNRSSEHIEKCIDIVQNYINKNYAGVLDYVKLTISSIVVMFLDMMPSNVQPFIKMFFSSVQTYHKKAMAEKQAAYDTQTETETENDT